MLYEANLVILGEIPICYSIRITLTLRISESMHCKPGLSELEGRVRQAKGVLDKTKLIGYNCNACAMTIMKRIKQKQ